jgi:hypothetical protein
MLEPAGLAQRRYAYVKAISDAAIAHLDEEEHTAELRLTEEKEAQQRVRKEERAVKAKSKTANEKAEAARAAWDRRNEAAAHLAALDRKASALQMEADLAAQELSDATWVCGERHRMPTRLPMRCAFKRRIPCRNSPQCCKRSR